jgi:hypothetical protein
LLRGARERRKVPRKKARTVLSQETHLKVLEIGRDHLMNIAQLMEVKTRTTRAGVEDSQGIDGRQGPFQ